MNNSIERYSSRLRLAVIANVFIVAAGLADYFRYFVPFSLEGRMWMVWISLVGGPIIFLAGLCGAVSGIPLVFRLIGFLRLVAVLAGLVSLYAMVRCVGFLCWSIGLP